MEETHRYGKLEWIFYIVVLPLLFTALLSGIILQFLGFDITGKVANAAKHVPGVSKLLPQDQQATADSTPSQPDPVQQKQEAEDKAKALESAKKQLEDDLVKKNAEIDQLKKQAEADKKKQAAEEEEAAPPPDPVKDMAKVYAQMSPAKAAAIMSNLSVTEAKEILSKMSSSQKAAILEKMEPLIASKILSS